MTEQTTGPTLIQSVQRALRLLEMVAEFDGRAQAKELARAAGFTLPTTYHLLRTMTHEGYLQPRWVPGSRAFEGSLTRMPTLAAAARMRAFSSLLQASPVAPPGPST